MGFERPICRKCGKPMELKVERLPDGKVKAEYRCPSCIRTISEGDDLAKLIEGLVKVLSNDLIPHISSVLSSPQQEEVNKLLNLIEKSKINCPICGAEDETTVKMLRFTFKCGHIVEITIGEVLELLRSHVRKNE